MVQGLGLRARAFRVYRLSSEFRVLGSIGFHD